MYSLTASCAALRICFSWLLRTDPERLANVDDVLSTNGMIRCQNLVDRALGVAFTGQRQRNGWTQMRCMSSTASRRMEDRATKKKISEEGIEPSILSV